MSRRVVLAAGAVLLAAAIFVGVARWERGRAGDEQAAGLRAVLTAMGGRIDKRTLSGYRIGPPDCLSYHDTIQRFAYQLCFDREGTLVTAVDRRGIEPIYYNLDHEPALSPIRFPRDLVDHLLRSAEAASH